MKKVIKQAYEFFNDNYIMIASLEIAQEKGCAEKILNILKSELTKGCEYCDYARKDKSKIGYNLDDAKFCPMCGDKL